MPGKKKTGRWVVGNLAYNNYDAEKNSDEDSDDEWKPNTGGDNEEEEGDKDDEDDYGPKLVHQTWMKNELDLMERCKWYEQKIRHLQLELRMAMSCERQTKRQIRMDYEWDGEDGVR